MENISNGEVLMNLKQDITELIKLRKRLSYLKSETIFEILDIELNKIDTKYKITNDKETNND